LNSLEYSRRASARDDTVFSLYFKGWAPDSLEARGSSSFVSRHDSLPSASLGEIEHTLELIGYPAHAGVSVNEYLAKLAMIYSFRWGKNPLILGMGDVTDLLYRERLVPGALPGIKRKILSGIFNYYQKSELTIGDFAYMSPSELRNFANDKVMGIHRQLNGKVEP